MIPPASSPTHASSIDLLSVGQSWDDGDPETATYETYGYVISNGTWSFTYDGNGNVAWKNKSTEKWS